MKETALITGASSGIGEHFARQLASKKKDLVLVARSQDKLEKLAKELEEKEQVNTIVIVQDLTQPNAGQILYDAIEAQGLTIDVLINNAGFGDYGMFSDRPLSKQMKMIQLNIAVLTELTGLFLPDMKKRRKGAIVNVSSIAGFQPLPYMSVYAATKAFVLSFSEALWAENKDYGISILALCPGPTESQFAQRAEFPDSFAEQNKNSLVSSEEVVQEALKALDKNQSTVVTGGFGNQVIVNVSRFFPRDYLVSAIKQQFTPKEKV